MGYIETEKVAEIRKKVRAEFPAFKISVTRDHYSTVNVRIMKGPVDVQALQSLLDAHKD